MTHVVTTDAHFDEQAHLNNAAIVGLFNDLRIAYVQQCIGPRWTDHLRAERLGVAARELHVLYESEGRPGESFVGATRYTRREGKAAVVEQRLLEAVTERPVASAWVVQLLARRSGGRLARLVLGSRRGGRGRPGAARPEPAPPGVGARL